MRSGSIVEIGENRGLRYRVIAIHLSRAWLEPMSKYGALDDCIVPVDRLREVGSVFPTWAG